MSPVNIGSISFKCNLSFILLEVQRWSSSVRRGIKNEDGDADVIHERKRPRNAWERHNHQGIVKLLCCHKEGFATLICRGEDYVFGFS